MVRTVIIEEFDKKKYPNIAREFPSMRYHSDLMLNKYKSLNDAIYHIKNQPRNKKAKVLIIKLKKLSGRTKTVFKRTDYERNL